MKKILIITEIIVGVYFLLGVILNVNGACPKYINLMPKVSGPDIPNIKGPNDPQLWHVLFCPFAKKSY